MNNKTISPSTQEIWKPVEDFVIQWTDVAIYHVSNLGRIKSFKRTESYIVTNIHNNNKGYPIFQFRYKDKRKALLVHRMVYIAFHGPTDKPIIHLDGNKENNSLDNLALKEEKPNENSLHIRSLKTKKHHLEGKTGASHPKSTPILQLDINGDIVNQWASMNEVQTKTGWNRSHISRSIKSQRLAYGFLWKKL